MSADSDGTRRGETTAEARRNNPMHRLVPYLDLFARLDDEELARLAAVGPDMVATLRRQVNDICSGLAGYVDLLPRLGDEELVRLSGASIKTIRFWRLCQPRAVAKSSVVTPPPRAAPTPVHDAPTAPHRVGDPPPEPQPRRRTGGVATQPTVLATGAPEQPIADWSSEAPTTNARTTITGHGRAAWDTSSPTTGATMITPVGMTPDVTWGDDGRPSETSTRPGAETDGAQPIDPAQRQQSASQLMNFDGEPFPGYEQWRPPTHPPDDEADFTVDLDR